MLSIYITGHIKNSSGLYRFANLTFFLGVRDFRVKRMNDKGNIGYQYCVEGLG